MGEEEGFEDVQSDGPKSVQEKCRKEREAEEEERRAGMRCHQEQREISENQPSELDAAAPVITDSLLSLVSLHCTPHQSFDSVDFDLELTAEVRLEDGSSLAFLSSVTPRFHSPKSGIISDHLPLTLKQQSSVWRSKQEQPFWSNCHCPAFLPAQPRVISVTQTSTRNTTSVALKGAIQAAKSPLPSCPSTSPSSPSSAPSSPSPSPSSSSSSPVGTATSFHDNSHGCAAGVNHTTGDTVSSTSVSLPPPSLSLPPSSSTPSVHIPSTPPHPGSGGDQENMDIYDPFHPTEGEGEREGGAAKEEEEEEGDKYDPFDPTGSPASEREKERRAESAVSADSEKTDALGGMGEERAGDDKDQKDIAPPDSTAQPPASPISSSSPSHPPRRREETDKDERQRERGSGGGKGGRERGKDKGKGARERRETNSDTSEIEEGEIVAAGEKERERERKRDREGERGHLSDSPFLHSCPKPERILRVLDGDDFVSVRAEGDWMLERDGGSAAGVGDLRRKLVSRRKERYRSCPSSSSLSPPPPLPVPALPPSVPVPTEKAKSRKSSKSSKERERRKRKQEREGEKGERRRRRRAKEGGSQEKKERDKDGERKGRDKKGKDVTSGRSSRSNSSKRKKKRPSPELSSHSRTHTTSLHTRHSRRSWSSPSEDRHRDRDRDRDRERDRDRDRDRDRNRDRDRERERDSERDRDQDRDRDRERRRNDRERERERDLSSHRRKRERGEEDGEFGGEERGGGRKRAKVSRERREREHERDRDRRRRDGRPVVPPSIQDLNGSDLFAIKRTITVTTTTTTTTVPGSPQLQQTTPDTPPPSSNKQRKKKHKRKRRLEEEDDDEDEERLSRSGDSSLTPLRYRLGYESDHFSDKLGVDMLSLDGEAMDSDYPSLEDSPLPLRPITPPLSTKTKPKTKSGSHSKKKARPGKKTTASEPSLRQKTNKSLPSLSPSSTPSIPAPPLPTPPVTKRARKVGKEKGGKKEAGRSGKTKKLSSSTRKGKLQSKVSVLVREGVSSTTGGSGSGKLGVIASSKDLPGSGGANSGSVVGGSIAVVFRRDNESRSPFLKPSSEPISLSGRNKEFGKARKSSTLAPPSSSSSTHGSVLKSKKAKPSSTTSASSSSASSPSSFSLTKRRRKPGKRQREHREKGGVEVEGDGANANSSVEGGSWAMSVSDIQSGSAGSAKPSSPLTGPPAPTPSSSSSSSSTSVPPPSSPPCTPPLCGHPSRDTRESTPDSQTVDSSCKTPEPNFLPEDGPSQSQTTLLTPPSNIPSSPLPLQAAQGGVLGISQSTPDLKNPTDEQKTPTSPPCPSSSNSLSVAPSSVDPTSSVSSSSVNKPPPPPPPPPAAQPLPWSLQRGVDCTAGGVLALTALLFKMEEANLASRAKAQEFIQATSQILSQANQSQSQQLPLPSSSSSSSSSSQAPPPSSLTTPPAPSPAQFILHGSLPLVSCTKTPPSHLHPSLSLAGGCAQTPPAPMHGVSSGAIGASSETGWDSESKDPEKYMKKLHTQERAVEEVKLAIKPYYQRKDITKEEYKDILRKAVHKICHSRTGEINPVKVSNLVKLYVQRYKYFRKHGRKMDEEEREGERERGGGGVTNEPGALHSSM